MSMEYHHQSILLHPSLGYHVTVADGGHGDEGPPQAQRDGRKVVVGIGLKLDGMHELSAKV